MGIIFDKEGKSISERLRDEGFIYYFLAVFLVMFVFLSLFGFAIDYFFYEGFHFQDYVTWDLPFDIILSATFAVWTWFFKGKRMKLKSNVIRLNLDDDRYAGGKIG